MININKIISAIFLIIASELQAGPFGLEMGMSIDQIDPDAKEVKPGTYLLSKVPKPHSSFEMYMVTVSPNSGLSSIKAVSEVKTNSYGTEIRNAFFEMSAKLEKVYGKGDTTDELISGSIWNRPNDFLMSLRMKERLLACVWNTPKNANNIEQIILASNTDSNITALLFLQYNFTNAAIADKEIAALEDDAL